MAEALKILGQAVPGAVLTDLYTVPTGRSATCSSLIVCNRANASKTFRVAVAVAGAADATKQYLYYDTTIAANATERVTIGMTLAALDVVRVYAADDNVSFNLFGVESD